MTKKTAAATGTKKRVGAAGTRSAAALQARIEARDPTLTLAELFDELARRQAEIERFKGSVSSALRGFQALV
jgi:hypothetical protein